MRPSRQGAFLFPSNYSPYRKSKLNNIQCGTAVKSEPKVVAEPSGIPERPEPEAKGVLFYIEYCSRQTDCRNHPSEGGDHENNPSLHISAKRGSRRRNSSITCAGVTFSRYESSSSIFPLKNATVISGEPIWQEMAQCTSSHSG